MILRFQAINDYSPHFLLTDLFFIVYLGNLIAEGLHLREIMVDLSCRLARLSWAHFLVARTSFFLEKRVAKYSHAAFSVVASLMYSSRFSLTDIVIEYIYCLFGLDLPFSESFVLHRHLFFDLFMIVEYFWFFRFLPLTKLSLTCLPLSIGFILVNRILHAFQIYIIIVIQFLKITSRICEFHGFHWVAWCSVSLIHGFSLLQPQIVLSQQLLRQSADTRLFCLTGYLQHSQTSYSYDWLLLSILTKSTQHR